MHCNLRPPDATPVVFRFNYDAMSSLKSLNLSIAVLWHFWSWYITLRCDLTFDLWPWTFAVYRLWRDETLYQIWTQSNNSRRSYSDFDIRSYGLEHVLHVALASWIIFHQVWPFTTYPCLNYSVFMLIRYVTLWPWPLTRWPWKFVIQQASRDQSVRNLSDIEQSPAELLLILRIYAHVMLWCDLDLSPVDLTSGVLCLNSVQNLSEIK